MVQKTDRLEINQRDFISQVEIATLFCSESRTLVEVGVSQEYGAGKSTFEGPAGTEGEMAVFWVLFL